MHDVLDDRDLVPDEAQQLLHSGFPAESLLAEARQAADRSDYAALTDIRQRLSALDRRASWPWDEPDDLGALERLARQVDPLPVASHELPDRVHGAWLGRCVGNTLGKPVEGLTRDEVQRYLRAAGQWPLRGYVPLLPELPEGVSHLHESAPFASAGLFTDVPRDDDLDWTVLGLWMLEELGAELTTEAIAATWLDKLPFTQTFTAERAVYRNVVRGVAPSAAARVDNPYREWIGALIRGDVFGYVRPGNPGAAARLVLPDATFSHVGNGVYGEMWAAALLAASFATTDARVALEAAVGVVPERSRLAAALRSVLALHRRGASLDEVSDWVDTELGHYNWVHTVNNAAIISVGLLWGESFLEAAGIAIGSGRDTDSTGATVGSVWGALHGVDGIPQELVGTTHVHLRSSIPGFDRIPVAELAERTLRLVADAAEARA
ncbi:hypothetical protein GCM10025864_09490 [Luteimicrobium album]|uniref:ADP-ribosylglycohydrolase family protein n=1 Tax=Luteimicrobium album TaxID=1054550 RepID=A0ABQ6I090_9MICO|nr:ADP-ribosylglycohydrolase family protein [Luteimicrobium album]GMA23190.1 hypothetical protein GCM10025864_09490 [Luteimicrobium album]